MSDTPLQQTPLNELHVSLGAKMVPFAGYSMPVQYPDGIIKEHNHTRSAAGLFDVSHMGQVILRGEHAAAALERLVPVDIVDLPLGRQRYALFTDDQGGILDDFMVANLGDYLYLVVNAARKAEDIAHLRENLGPGCSLEVLEDRALVALQGPQAATVLAAHITGLDTFLFMHSGAFTWQGHEVLVSRSGYTGEDGFEISIPASVAESFARTLLADPRVACVGLGARDSLRLEAGLCLYGHDLDPEHTPVESSLNWALSKVRRAGGARAGGYPGAAVVEAQLAEGVGRKRVGLLPTGRAPVREGAPLLSESGEVVGEVTSGGFSPTLGVPIAMGYVKTELSQEGTEILAEVRGRSLPVRVAKMPFVPQRYYRG